MKQSPNTLWLVRWNLHSDPHESEVVALCSTYEKAVAAGNRINARAIASEVDVDEFYCGEDDQFGIVFHADGSQYCEFSIAAIYVDNMP